MGLFKEKRCAECGKKINFFTATDLVDGKQLCIDCASCIPEYMQDTVRKSYTLDDYHGLKNYWEITNKELRAVFKATQSFHGLKIDTENKIFCISRLLEENNLYLNFIDIEEFDLVFVPEELKEGIFNDKVVGKVLMQIKHNYPYFYYETVLAKNIKSSAKQKFFGAKVEYQMPKEMEEFLTFFNLSRNKAIDDEIERLKKEGYSESYNYDSSDGYYNRNGNNSDNLSEFEKAMALFMFDNTDEITLSILKAQRNRLMKIYHPDSGTPEDTKFTQKINTAYEILKKYVEEK